MKYLFPVYKIVRLISNKLKQIIGFKDVSSNEKKDEDVKEEIINEEPNKYFEYTVEKEDTLMGIALKFDVNIQVLERVNSLSEGNVYPNQVFSF